jgi:hypothetical protein
MIGMTGIETGTTATEIVIATATEIRTGIVMTAETDEIHERGPIGFRTNRLAKNNAATRRANVSCRLTCSMLKILVNIAITFPPHDGKNVPPPESLR